MPSITPFTALPMGAIILFAMPLKYPLIPSQILVTASYAFSNAPLKNFSAGSKTFLISVQRSPNHEPIDLKAVFTKL